MFNKMIVRKMVFPVASAAHFTASVSAASEEKKDESKKDENQKDEEKKDLVRRKELPLYPAKKEDKPSEDEKKDKEKEEKKDPALMSAVKQVREAVWSLNKQVHEISDAVNHVIETGKAHTASAIDTLREEKNYPQRYGAIAAGGLVGYIIAFRRGWFRKIVYTGTGAAAVAAVVYPEEAKEYSSEGFRIAKKYIVIAYHFINGDKSEAKDTNKKQGKDTDKKKIKDKKEKEQKDPPETQEKEVEPKKEIEPKPASFLFPDPHHPTAEQDSYYSMYSRRA